MEVSLLSELCKDAFICARDETKKWEMNKNLVSVDKVVTTTGNDIYYARNLNKGTINDDVEDKETLMHDDNAFWKRTMLLPFSKTFTPVNEDTTQSYYFMDPCGKVLNLPIATQADIDSNW